jgi:two-component system CheB/CheR fusion protein
MHVWLKVAFLLAVAVIGTIDYLTGPELGNSFFYLLPVSLAAWMSERRFGLYVAVCAAVAWMAADSLSHQYSHPLLAYWNPLIRLSVFVTVALLVSHVRALTEALRQRVLEKSDALAVEIDRHEVTRDALEQTEQQFRILVEGLHEFAIFMLDADGNIAAWNKGAQSLLGYEASHAIGRHCSCFWPPEDAARELPREAIDCALREGVWENEGWRVRSDGSRFWASAMICPLRDPTGNLRGFSKVIHDVTARKRLEDEILANEDAERQRIGQEMHDVVGQDLTAVALLSKELEERLSTEHRPDSRLAARITRSANQALDHVRRLSKGLSALRLETGGLSAALEQLALDVEQVFGVGCRLEGCDCHSPRHPLIDLHLYRIAQEAVTNAIKHGGARDVWICLNDGNGRLTLRIEDDGVGLPDQPQDGQGLGTSIMRYRARTIGGHLSFQRLSPRGTAVLCTVPDAAWARTWQNDNQTTNLADQA